MFLLPRPLLHVNRELIDQMSITWAPWREGPSLLCWAYMSTARACSQADGDFYVLPTRDRSCWSYSVQSPDCQAKDISAPMLLGHGMWCGDCNAFKIERFRASPSLAVKHTLYSGFFPLKHPLVTPVACCLSAESSLSHHFKFWRHFYISELAIVWWGEERRASQLSADYRYLGILVACGDTLGFSCRSVEGLKHWKWF